MTNKLDLLDAKIRKVIEDLQQLRKENDRLRSDNETLKSQIALTAGEGRKAQRLLAEYDQMKRSHEQVVGRVERALQKLNAFRLQ